MKAKRYATININEGNLPFARPIGEHEFNKLTELDRAMFGDSIIYIDDDMYLHIPFKNVRHMQPLSEDKKDYYKGCINDYKGISDLSNLPTGTYSKYKTNDDLNKALTTLLNVKKPK